jgi:tetratricopeptide (TPR) repeat protein
MTAQEIEAKLDQDLSVVSKWLLWAWAVGLGSIVARYVVLLVLGKLHLGVLGVTGLAFVSVLWAMAWLAGGFLFGFLFGIPKVQQKDTPNPSSSHLKVNTNLEDISDWLTKILVGATLTQLMKIPSAVSTAAQFMARGDADPSRVSFNAAILVYFLMLGILAGYLLTRMFFAVAFARADSAPDHWAQILAPLSGAPIALGQGLPATNSATQSAAMASKNIPLTQSLSAEQAVAVAVGASIAGDPERALKASTLAVQQSPNDPGAQYSYAVALFSMEANPERTLAAMESAATKSSAATDKTLLESIYTSLTYLYLFQKPPDSYQHALDAAAAYDKKGGHPSAALEINRACAYGQEFRDVTKGEGPEPDNPVRNAALKAVKAAIDLEPQAALARLKQLLWVTGKDPQDNDLAVFQNDADFTTLLPKD